MNGSFRRVLRRNGYFNVKSTLEVAVKVNAVQVPRGFYDQTENWHITYGDSDESETQVTGDGPRLPKRCGHRLETADRWQAR